jgi:hypothetical protein
MGLDWCVMDKEKPGITEFLVGKARANVKEAENAHERAWEGWLAEGGHERPHHWPNDLQGGFDATEAAVAAKAARAEAAALLAECLITPMQTLGAPQVGIDEAATAYCREKYRAGVIAAAPGGHEVWGGRTEAEFLLAEHGKYVPQLVESDGIASMSGIVVGADSFRGKALRYCERVLDGTDLGERAYSDMSPSVLEAYGGELNDAADDFEYRAEERRDQGIQDRVVVLREAWAAAQTEEHGDSDDWPEEPNFKREATRAQAKTIPKQDRETSKEQLDIVRSAARWCLFWGTRGHGMHAWY